MPNELQEDCSQTIAALQNLGPDAAQNWLPSSSLLCSCALLQATTFIEIALNDLSAVLTVPGQSLHLTCSCTLNWILHAAHDQTCIRMPQERRPICRCDMPVLCLQTRIDASLGTRHDEASKQSQQYVEHACSFFATPGGSDHRQLWTSFSALSQVSLSYTCLSIWLNKCQHLRSRWA